MVTSRFDRVPARCWSRGPLAVALVVGLVGCAAGRDRVDPDRRGFERRLVERERITPAQARCVGRYVVEAYTPEEIRQIEEQGIVGLPSPRWAEYGHAMVGCLFHDELTGGGEQRTPGPAARPRPGA